MLGFVLLPDFGNVLIFTFIILILFAIFKAFGSFIDFLRK